MKHTLSVTVQDKPGALTRITTMFARRGFNIESLAVGPTERPGVSCITLRVDCTQHSLEQIEKQIHKLVNVLRVTELVAKEHVVPRRFATGFALGLLAKDVRIAADLGEELALDLPLFRLARERMALAREMEGSGSDSSRAFVAIGAAASSRQEQCHGRDGSEAEGSRPGPRPPCRASASPCRPRGRRS